MDEKIKDFLSKCKILPHDEYLKNIAEGGILMCVRKADCIDPFPDNLTGNCAVCNEEITYRPYNEPAINKVCIECAIKLKEAEKGEVS